MTLRKSFEREKIEQREPVIIAESELNKAQKALEYTTRIVTGFAPAVFFGANVFPPLPLPYSTVMASASIALNDKIGGALGMLAYSELHDVAEYLRASGGGNAGVGFLKEAGKFLALLTPALAFGYGAGEFNMRYADEMPDAALDAIRFVVEENPLLSSAICGMLGFGMVQAGNKILEHFWPHPATEMNKNPELNLAHRAGQYALRYFGGMTMAEALRAGLMFYNLSAVPMNSFFPVTAMIADQLLQGAGYLATHPNPIEELASQKAVSGDEEAPQNIIFQDASLPPSSSAKAKGMGKIALRTTIAIGFAIVGNEVCKAVCPTHSEPSTGERLMQYAGVLAFGWMAEGAIRNASYFGAKLSQCSQGLFSGFRSTPPLDETRPLLEPNSKSPSPYVHNV